MTDPSDMAAGGEAEVEFGRRLEAIGDGVRRELRDKYEAREKAIPLCRETIRFSANAIRAVHRGEFDRAAELVGRARESVQAAGQALADHRDIYWAGFVHDAQKEFAEASITLALVSDDGLPDRHALEVEPAAYLNGLAEACGELRRHLLDVLRRGEIEAAERCLERMDDSYALLSTIDYPDAMTGGLRRNTDMVRGVLEKSRGDLTTAVRQRELERRLADLSGRLLGGGQGGPV